MPDKKNILVIGSSNTDLIIKLKRLPGPGETLMGSDLLTVPGGKGANQAVAAARSGGYVTFLAAVGEDAFGKQAVEGYKKDQIDVSGIKSVADKPSGVALINVSESGENSISVAPGANNCLLPEDIGRMESMFDQADVVLLQLEIPMETVEKSIIMAQKAGAQIILNPAPAAKIKEEYLKKIDFLTPNESEARLLAESNDTDPEKLAAQLSAYAKNVIMTLGSKGVYCHTKDFSDYIAGFKVEAMDTTAAGDVFNGALAVGLCEKDSVQEAIHFANAAAALSVMKMGAQSSVPSRQDIDRFVEMNLHR